MSIKTTLSVWLGRALEWGRRIRAVPVIMLGLAGAAMAADKPLPPDMHKFTNKDGASINAQIQSIVDDEVNLKRDDGKDFRIKIDTVSADDQNYITKWAIKQAVEREGKLFLIAILSKASDKTVTDQNGYTTTTWPEGYQVTFKNQAVIGLNNLRVEYVAFWFKMTYPPQHPNGGTEEHFSGTATIDGVLEKDALKDANSATIETKTAKLQIKSLDMAYVVPPSQIMRTATDRMDGVWLRVFDAQGNLLQEWSSNEDLTKTLTWESVYAPPRAPRAAAAAAAAANPDQP